MRTDIARLQQDCQKYKSKIDRQQQQAQESMKALQELSI